MWFSEFDFRRKHILAFNYESVAQLSWLCVGWVHHLSPLPQTLGLFRNIHYYKQNARASWGRTPKFSFQEDVLQVTSLTVQNNEDRTSLCWAVVCKGSRRHYYCLVLSGCRKSTPGKNVSASYFTKTPDNITVYLYFTLFTEIRQFPRHFALKESSFCCHPLRYICLVPLIYRSRKSATKNCDQ